MEPMRVELSVLAKVVIVLGLVASLGVLALFLWWMIRHRYPHVLDAEGVMTRARVHRRWADVTEVLTLRTSSSTGLRITFNDGGRIHVVPNMLRDPDLVLAYIERCGVKSSSWR